MTAPAVGAPFKDSTSRAPGRIGKEVRGDGQVGQKPVGVDVEHLMAAALLKSAEQDAAVEGVTHMHRLKWPTRLLIVPSPRVLRNP